MPSDLKEDNSSAEEVAQGILEFSIEDVLAFKTSDLDFFFLKMHVKRLRVHESACVRMTSQMMVQSLKSKERTCLAVQILKMLN